MSAVSMYYTLQDSVEDYIPRCAYCEEKKEPSQVMEDEKTGRYVCQNCGTVVGDQVISEGSEWRTFENDGTKGNTVDPNRVGGADNPLLGDSNLSTVIGKEGSGFDESSSYLSRAQNRANGNKEKALIHAFGLTAKLAGRMALPQIVVNLANELYKELHESHEVKGRKTEAIVIACLYIGCRQNGCPRTLKEISGLTDVRLRDVQRCFTKIKKLNKLFKTYKAESEKAPRASSFITRFCSLLKLPAAVVTTAEAVCDRTEQMGLVDGRNPSTVAAGAIYMIVQNSTTYKRTPKEVGMVVGLAEATVVGIARLLQSQRSKLLAGYENVADAKQA